MYKSLFESVEVCLLSSFLDKRSPQPLLLALSGGSDSLFLFFALLDLREKHAVLFHVAHVDHGWREESKKEGEQLMQLAASHGVPFHLKVLDPSQFNGNLEEASRNARYDFFGQLHQEHRYAGLVTGHHYGDAIETTLKRMFEGAHWSKWNAMEMREMRGDLPLLRPLLNHSKKEIQQALAELGNKPFEDSTNRDTRFLRARMREELIPLLAKTFGKEIEKSLLHIRSDVAELKSFFDKRLSPLLKSAVKETWGTFLDCSAWRDMHLLELKLLIRELCRQHSFTLSRESLAQAASALQKGKANCRFEKGENRVEIDRGIIRVFGHKIVYKRTLSLIESGK